MTKQIKIDGSFYTVRYTYTKENGSVWYVLLVDGGFFGEFGDEVPASMVVGKA